jgi:serine/threonine protein kinase
MINSIIGNYKITKLIGEGGMATVYEAEHKLLGSKVAIKVLNPTLSSNAQIKERFINEAKLMASLDHPNITRVIDFDDQPNQLSIVMEFLKGEDLNQKIKREGALKDAEIANVFTQTLSAFQYAHEEGIVHRDIKPSNIFILPNGTVKILDFGIAKLFGQSNEMTQTGTQMGTPIYMSPEQVKADKTIDHRSDIYSLGVTLFYALNGKPPYDANSSSQFDIFNKIVYEPLALNGVNSHFEAIIRKACAIDRDERFQTCTEWLKEFSGVAHSPADLEKTQFEQAPIKSAANTESFEKEEANVKTIIQTSDNSTSSSSSKDSLKPADKKESEKNTSRPIFLSMLCVLAWIGSGITLLFMYHVFRSATGNINAIAIEVFCISGSIMMWKLKKAGFYIYLIGKLTLFFYLADIYGSFNLIFHATLSLPFVILYAILFTRFKRRFT